MRELQAGRRRLQLCLTAHADLAMSAVRAGAVHTSCHCMHKCVQAFLPSLLMQLHQAMLQWVAEQLCAYSHVAACDHL